MLKFEKLRRFFRGGKKEHLAIYSYSVYAGEKGVIVAASYEEAVCIFKTKYPGLYVTDNEDHELYKKGHACLWYECPAESGEMCELMFGL